MIKLKLLSVTFTALAALVVGMQIGKMSAPQQTVYGLVCADGSAPQIVPIQVATPVPTPTLSSPTPTPIWPSTATAAALTPTKVPTALTPPPSPTYNGLCQWVLNGAEWYQPKGQSFYIYNDAQNTGIAKQNVRSGPGTNYSIVGQIGKGEEHLVWFSIQMGTQTWVSLDETCAQWVAVWLGYINVHP
jgi:hypothetical protein